MLVSDIISIAKYGELQQLSVKEKDEAIISYINMGVLELYKRFKVATKVEIINTLPIVAVYSLMNSDVMRVEEVYDADGKQLLFPSTIGDEEYDIKALGLTTFLLKKPKEESLAFVYTSSPTTLTATTDEVFLPDSMVEALLHYVGYRGHGSIDGNINGENNTHYMRFEKSCKELSLQGYGEVTDIAKRNVAAKGFV